MTPSICWLWRKCGPPKPSMYERAMTLDSTVCVRSFRLNWHSISLLQFQIYGSVPSPFPRKQLSRLLANPLGRMLWRHNSVPLSKHVVQFRRYLLRCEACALDRAWYVWLFWLGRRKNKVPSIWPAVAVRDGQSTRVSVRGVNTLRDNRIKLIGLLSHQLRKTCRHLPLWSPCPCFDPTSQSS